MKCECECEFKLFFFFFSCFLFQLRSFWQLSIASGIHTKAGVIESFFLVMSFDSKIFGVVQPCGAILHLSCFHFLIKGRFVLYQS